MYDNQSLYYYQTDSLCYQLHINGTQKLREEYDQAKQIKLKIDQTRKERNHLLEEQEYLTDQTRRRLDQDRNMKNQQNNNNRDTLYQKRPNSEETGKRNKKYRRIRRSQKCRTSNLKIIHANARGLISKMQSIQSVLDGIGVSRGGGGGVRGS